MQRLLALSILFFSLVVTPVFAQKVVERYDNGQKKYQGKTKGSLKVGTHNFWFENGEKKREEKYNDLGGLIRLKEWNEAGELIKDEKPEEVLEEFRRKLFNETAWIAKDGIYFYKLKGENALQDRTDHATIFVHYATYLENGKELDNSFRTKKPLLIDFNSKSMISGFIRGLRFFEKGDNGYIKIPSELAYGKDGTQGIPPQSTIYFHVLVIGTS